MLSATRLIVGVAGSLVIFAGTAVLAAPPAMPNPGARIPNPGPRPQMMPGQDWWKIYPWSSYNAWRNPYWYPPYNPNYPYAPNEAYGPGYAPIMPSYLPGTTPLPEWSAPNYQPPAERKEEARVPHPSGELKAAPANAAVIRLEMPDRFATVRFDGQKVSSVGSTRYYVTPTLEAGKTVQYTVSTVVDRDGRQTTLERKIDVTPGQIVPVVFTR